MVQFLDPETAKILQFLDPEIVNMDQKLQLIQSLKLLLPLEASGPGVWVGSWVCVDTEINAKPAQAET